jgi:tRNA pseudouridine55 synthase
MDSLNNLCGYIPIDKAEGFTSFDVCAVVRRAVGVKRVGHTGTLDPLATGVLPVLIGRATLAADILPVTDKTYAAGLMFGAATDTQDCTGSVKEQSDKRVTAAELTSYLEYYSIPRVIAQIPPMYSAVKIGGERLYDIARSGKTVERKPREVTIYSILLDDFDETAQTAAITVSCSAGTYVRTLIDDMGRALGTFAHMTALRRIAANGIDIADCTAITAIKAHPETATALIQPIEALFSALPAINLNVDLFGKYRNGNKLPTELPDGRYRIYTDSVFIGTGCVTENHLKSEKYFVI